MQKKAIVKYFQSTEAGIEKSCESCPSTKCSKSLNLLWSPNFILIQFKRFTAKRSLRNTALLSKINAESEPFSVVDINTTQGVQRYKVFATIEHKGNTFERGHYVSYLLRNELWYCCDDSSVESLPNDDEKPTRNMYIVLLKKV